MFDNTKIFIYNNIVMERLVKQIGMEGISEENELLAFSIFDNGFDELLKSDFILPIKNGTVCLTGNRPASLPWKYNEDCEFCLLFKERLKKFFVKLVELGYSKFISGLAMGFDIIATEILIKLKSEGYDIFIEGAVPCLNQTRGWKNDYIKRYQNVLDSLDKVTFTSNYAFFEGCYQIRNRYMVDNSDLIVGCQIKKSAGTKSTLEYAQKLKKNIIILS